MSITPGRAGYVQNLDEGTIPQDVEQAFQSKGISLTGATVQTIAMSSSWLIIAAEMGPSIVSSNRPTPSTPIP